MSDKLRESEYEGFAGKSLRVYPHLSPDQPDIWMASAGHVEALPYWDEGNVKTWSVQTISKSSARIVEKRLKISCDLSGESLQTVAKFRLGLPEQPAKGNDASN